MVIPLIVVLIIALVVSLALTPVMSVLARRYHLVDRPSADRKLHQTVVPLGGGVAVFIAALVAVTVAALLPGSAGAALQSSVADLVSLALASAIIVAVGLTDDRHTLRGRQKLAGQLLAIGVLIFAGLSIREIQILGLQIDLGLLAVPFTVFWLLGAINAVNLLDGADGFATTIGIVISAALATMAALQGQLAASMVAIALTGALLGFLVFNFPPARIFLGDAGSMLIGLVIGVLAIRSSLKGPATVALAAPLALLTIPILDSAGAVLRRWLTGRSIYIGDRGHLHHTMQRRGLGPRGLLVGISLLCAVTAAGALVSVAMKNELCAVISAATVVGALIISRVFGFNELVLVTRRALGFGSSLVGSTRDRNRIRHETARLQGSRNWDELWSALTDFAVTHDLSLVRLDLNVAWLHEGYHAVWDRNEDQEASDRWLVHLPLHADGRLLGRLEIAGHAPHSAVHPLLALLAELLESLQPCMDLLSEDLPGEGTSEFEEHGVDTATQTPEEIDG
jgi:UDP-GlcNAc:undecaprenyl-phosphate GlcNAc-1-phosphate transferase